MTGSAMTFVLYVQSQPFLKARIYTSMVVFRYLDGQSTSMVVFRYLDGQMRTRKGQCVVAGCRKLSAKQTGFEHMRGGCRDDLPNAYRDVWHMWRPGSAG